MSKQFVQIQSDLTPMDWINDGAPGPIYQKLSKVTNPPTVPSPSQIYTQGGNKEAVFGVADFATTKKITAIKIHVYQQLGDLDAITFDIKYKNKGTWSEIKSFIQIVTNQWNSVEWTGLNLTPVDIDDFQVSLLSKDPLMLSAQVKQVVLEITMADVENADPLPKRKLQMSGYNYFCKHYVQRKNDGLKPYKLPTGELYP